MKKNISGNGEGDSTDHIVTVGDFRFADSKSDAPKIHEFRSHTHRKYEILYFLRGDVHCVVGNLRHAMQSGETVLIPPLYSHRMEILSSVPYERMVLNFDTCGAPTALLKKVFSSPKIIGAENTALVHVFSLLRNARTAFPKGERDALYPALLTELIYLLSLCEENRECAAFDGHTQAAEEIIGYIDEHLFEPLSIELLCRRFYLSPAYLHSLLKDALGMSPMRYIRTRRMLAAEEMLRLGEKATSVAQKVGYEDYASFYRAYRAYFGVSPLSARMS